MNYHATLIYRERMRRDWSQEGLCKGICTVSYLSKIENGKAEPSEDILRLLLQRLELTTDPALEAEAARLAEDGYEMLFTGRYAEFQPMMACRPWETYRATAAGLDFLLLQNWCDGEGFQPLDEGLEGCMDARQLAMQRILQKCPDDAIALLPNAFCHHIAGEQAYYAGDIPSALQYLQTAYDLAAREGAPFLMLDCKMFIGNCYNLRHDLAHMMEHYAVAKRLAAALDSQGMLDAIGYNTAAAQLDSGRYEEAYAYFSRLEDPEVMSLHKLAISCEKTGRRDDAIAALDRADACDRAQIPLARARQICGVVRYRLEHLDYLQREEYGRLLTECFDMCRRELPAGFAYSHLPWVIDWCKATRQYKRAFELISDFPEIRGLI